MGAHTDLDGDGVADHPGPCEDRADPASWDDPDIRGPWRDPDDADTLWSSVLDPDGWVHEAPPDTAARLTAPRRAAGVYLNDLPDVVRSAGLVCRPDPGFAGRNHGAMVAVRAVYLHHTGSSGGGAWIVVRDGRPDLKGPLAQLTIERDGSVRVLSNGQCWHAGTGSWPTIGQNNGNSVGIGIECVYDGSDITDAQRRTYLLLVVALVRHYRIPVANVIGHLEWAPRRKVDPGRIDCSAFRRDVAAALAAAPTPPAGGVYTVVTGDTLWALSQRFGTTVDALKAANGLTSDTLSIGQKLRLPGAGPAATRYTVVPGDTLWDLSRRFGVTVDALRAANGLTGDLLSVGQVLTIPGPAAAPAPAPPPAPTPPPTLAPAPASGTVVDVLAAFGMQRPADVAAIAADLGVALPVAAAFLEQETSTARNVWGHDDVDPAGLYIPGGEVTHGDYERYAARRKHQDVRGDGEVDTQGVGPLQITHWSLQDECDRIHGPGAGTWDWATNVRYGLDLIRRYLLAGRPENRVWDAAKRYNGKASYADEVVAKVVAWSARLAGATPIGPPAPPAVPADPLEAVRADLARIERKLDDLLARLAAGVGTP